MISIRKIVHSTGCVAVISLVNALMNFFINLYITRNATVSAVADYIFIMSLFAILSVLSSLGVDQHILRTLPGMVDAEANRHIRASNSLNLIGIGLSLSILLIVFAAKQYDWHLYFICAGSLALMASAAIRNALFTAREMVISINVFQKLLRNSSYLILLALLAYLVQLGTQEIFTAFLVTILLTTIISVIYLHRKTNLRYTAVEKNTDWNFVKATTWLFASSVLVTITGQADVLLVDTFLDDLQTANYGIAQRISLLSIVFLTSLNLVTMPLLAKSRHDKEQSSRAIFVTAAIATASSILFFGFCVLIGKQVLLLFGETYVLAYWILLILAFTQMVNSAFGQTMVLMKIHHAEKQLCAYLITAIVLKVFLSLAFVQHWGMYGIAVATFFSMLAWNILCAWHLIGKLRINPTILQPFSFSHEST